MTERPSWELWTRAAGELSGGEKTRAAIAKVVSQHPTLLLLDEPTNALDLASREAIEEALLAFDGTIVFVSHDRYLLQRLATKVLAVEDGNVHHILGDYTEYQRSRTMRQERSDLSSGDKNASQSSVDLVDGRMSTRDKKLMLETRLAVLSQRMAVADEADKESLGAEFIRIHRELRSLC